MNLDELTLGQLKQLQSVTKNGYEPIVEVGKAYFIRTVTHHYTGRCVRVNKDWFELTEAAWIADDGRFNNFLKTGEANEVEPYIENVRIPVGCVLDVSEWKHALFRAVK